MRTAGIDRRRPLGSPAMPLDPEEAPTSARPPGQNAWPLGFDVERPDQASQYRLIVNQVVIGVEVNLLSFDRLAGAHCLARLSVGWTQVTSLGEFLVANMDHEAIRAGVGSAQLG